MAVRIPSRKKKLTKVSKINPSRLWIMPALLFAFLLSSIFFLFSGNRLIANDDFEHIEWAVILAGQSPQSERSDAAVKLFEDQRITYLLVSSIPFFKSDYIGKYVIPNMLQQGVPEKNIFELKHQGNSTIEEAVTIIKQFRLLRIDTALIITSNFHTKRAKGIFNSLSHGNPHFLVHSAAFHLFDPHKWWSHRQSRKIFLLESLKQAASFIEVSLINWKKPIEGNGDQITIEPEHNLPAIEEDEFESDIFFDEDFSGKEKNTKEPTIIDDSPEPDSSSGSDSAKILKQ